MPRATDTAFPHPEERAAWIAAIREHIAATGKSLHALALETGIDRATLSRLANNNLGARGSLGGLVSYAAQLGMDVRPRAQPTPPDLATVIRTAIGVTLQQRNLTINAAAEMLGIWPADLSKYLGGMLDLYSLERQLEFLKALDVPFLGAEHLTASLARPRRRFSRKREGADHTKRLRSPVCKTQEFR